MGKRSKSHKKSAHQRSYFNKTPKSYNVEEEENNDEDSIIPLSNRDPKYRTCCKGLHCTTVQWLVGPLEFCWLLTDFLVVAGFLQFRFDLIQDVVVIVWCCMMAVCLVTTTILFVALRLKAPLLVLPHLMFQFLLTPSILACGGAMVAMMVTSRYGELLLREWKLSFDASTVLMMGIVVAANLVVHGFLEFYFLSLSFLCFKLFLELRTDVPDIMSDVVLTELAIPVTTPQWHNGTLIRSKDTEIYRVGKKKADSGWPDSPPMMDGVLERYNRRFRSTNYTDSPETYCDEESEDDDFSPEELRRTTTI